MLSAFPHLTASDFEKACANLIGRFHQHGDKQSNWQSLEIVHYFDSSYLKITRELPDQKRALDTSKYEQEQDEIEEIDDEVLSARPMGQALIHYDIILSPTYRFPTLYISISDPQHRYPPNMATLYEHLIPSHFRSQTDHVGIIGGITIIDHPTTGFPVFFVHPCQTAEVMEASVGRKVVSAEEYLIIWIGALGKCVGLSVPLALMQPDELGIEDATIL